ncbi:hypothetical protein Nepgr_018035 [Nepenthes gracilis]|uniref:Large ribosomal subunit protein bL31c n=1 Tax=Nepenthes gracilis TaxID=150966 RepID=A0AAD3SSR0_NEPGR|nr:hypothetical protein Nepgr_018035 [Nepenthes gracilis]
MSLDARPKRNRINCHGDILRAVWFSLAPPHFFKRFAESTGAPHYYLLAKSNPNPLPVPVSHSHAKLASMALALSNQFVQRSAHTHAILSLPKTATSKSHGCPQISCRKKDIHPQFHEAAKVYCNGELVMTTGGTQKEYTVDVWSGNHPFYLGNRSAVLVDAGQVEKFRKKFGELTKIMEIPVLKGEIVLPPKRKSAPAKGGKKK